MWGHNERREKTRWEGRGAKQAYKVSKIFFSVILRFVLKSWQEKHRESKTVPQVHTLYYTPTHMHVPICVSHF